MFIYVNTYPHGFPSYPTAMQPKISFNFHYLDLDPASTNMKMIFSAASFCKLNEALPMKVPQSASRARRCRRFLRKVDEDAMVHNQVQEEQDVKSKANAHKAPP